MWFQYLADLLLDKWLLIEYSEVLVRLRSLSESAVVLTRRVHLHKDILCVGRCSIIQKVVCRLRVIFRSLLEAFHSLEVDNLLDHMQTLQNKIDKDQTNRIV